MATLPTAEELKQRNQKAQEDLERFKVAHDTFFKEWDDIVNKKGHLLKDLHHYIDAEKLSAVTHYITQLKNNT